MKDWLLVCGGGVVEYSICKMWCFSQYTPLRQSWSESVGKVEGSLSLKAMSWFFSWPFIWLGHLDHYHQNDHCQAVFWGPSWRRLCKHLKGQLDPPVGNVTIFNQGGQLDPPVGDVVFFNQGDQLDPPVGNVMFLNQGGQLDPLLVT